MYDQNTLDAFDYIMNTRALYDAMGAAVRFAKSRKVEAMLYTERVVVAARADYLATCGEEDMPAWYHALSTAELLDYCQRRAKDRWDAKPSTPYTSARCSCRRGVQRANCPTCEGSGKVIDFATIRAVSKILFPSK